jgi:hypothetical protein
MYLPGKDDCTIEKFIKSFSEGLGYLEKLLLYQNNIHPKQLYNVNLNLVLQPENIVQKLNEIEKAMLTEIDRQYRHYSFFLSSIIKR